MNSLDVHSHAPWQKHPYQGSSNINDLIMTLGIRWMFFGIHLTYVSFSCLGSLLLQCGCFYMTANDSISLANQMNSSGFAGGPKTVTRWRSRKETHKYVWFILVFILNIHGTF